jgi:hypothetical protein
MKRLLLVLTLLAPLKLYGQFSTVTCTHGETGTCRQATTCGQSDVQAAVDASAASISGGYSSPTSFTGDGVYVPAGSCTWSSGLSWSNKNINLIGANPTITESSGNMLSTTVTGNGAHAASFHVSGFTWNGGSSSHLLNVNNSNPNLTAWAGYFRIDNITTSSSSSGNVAIVYGPVWGVMDHLNVTWSGGNFLEQSDFLNPECVTNPGTTTVYMGEYSWRTLPIALGSRDAIYIEDSTFTYTGGAFVGAITDSESGGQRMVFRHNSVTGPTFHFAHWTRGGGGSFCYNGEVDGHKYEIYNNTYNGQNSGSGFPMRFGSGTGVIFNNQVTGYSDPTLHINETRGSGGEVSNANMFSCDGSQSVDGNAGDASAPGWPCAGQIGNACKAGSCARNAMDSVPLLAWNNGAQAGCASGGTCTNTVTLILDGQMGSGNTVTRPMANYVKSSAHSVSGPLNGAFDYCQGGTTMPASCGIYTNTYAAYSYPYPATTGAATYTLTPSFSGTGFGTVSCSPTGAGIAAGTPFSCTATPTSGYFTTAFSGCGGTLTGATLAGNMPSADCGAAAVFSALVAHPTFAPVAGTYAGVQSVVISSTTSAVTFCYTLNGSTPTTDDNGNCTGSSITYTGPVSVASNLTINVKGTKNGYVTSSQQAAAYVITGGGSGISTGVKFSPGVRVQ